MRTLSNGLIVSLATADFLVALAVMPISLHRELTGGLWTLGWGVCEFWLTADVLCCSASILNIAAIALDRYWLITRNVKYTHSDRWPRKRICILLITSAWSSALLISCSPLLGWRSGTERDDPTQCLLSQDYAYTLFSTVGAFWLPLFVILAVYFRVFRVARKRAVRRRVKQPRVLRSSILNVTRMSVRNSTGNCMLTEARSSFLLSENGLANTFRKISTTAAATTSDLIRIRQSRRMRKSARTLGLIIGGFLICWLPFFVLATITPFCPDICRVPQVVSSLALWLGYFNSMMNPIIYAIWDDNFRRAFKRLTFCNFRQ
ncbi:hypothetical protein HELRODRAFT_187611 [Helobdella robusta]|uniref:G-protein coupled receptors family 1 profile domain-containing protein n=1 Tax=Helobdella robusta TaxID=6412 RepID=T1FPB0_HELRO|nr:hypothetical protein HELRODRAFT_187611 [Helobdella robusta]ESN91971.1 hypothetical protein HELRODRAFT_187611 [Helobdella robusta]